MAEYPENCGSGEDMKVDGKVGIGTTSPQQKLDVIGTLRASTSTSGNVGANYLATDVSSNANFQQFDCGGSCKNILHSAGDSYVTGGNVGINTTSPGEKLEVQGNIKVSPGGNYNSGHLVLGDYHIWVDNDGKLRIKNSPPVGDNDGTVVGSQS